MDTERLRRAGAALAAERHKRGISLERMSGLTELSRQKLSSVENGAIQKPPFEMVRYGSVLGYDPNSLATLFGYWDAPHGSQISSQINRISSLVQQLPENERGEAVEFIENYITTLLRRNEKGA